MYMKISNKMSIFDLISWLSFGIILACFVTFFSITIEMFVYPLYNGLKISDIPINKTATIINNYKAPTKKSDIAKKYPKKEKQIIQVQVSENQVFENIKQSHIPDNEKIKLNESANIEKKELLKEKKVTIIKRKKPIISRKKAESLFNPIIHKVSNKYSVDPSLIKAIIMAESSYNPSAVSIRGAIGLMQIMPETAKDLGISDCFNPENNINGGVKYFKQLANTFNGDVKLALAAYNAGIKNVLDYKGVPPFKATKFYIKKVLGYYEHYKNQNTTNKKNNKMV